MIKIIVGTLLAVGCAASASPRCPSFQGVWKNTCTEKYTYFSRVNYRQSRIKLQLFQPDCSRLVMDDVEFKIGGAPVVQEETKEEWIQGSPGEPTLFKVVSSLAAQDESNNILTLLWSKHAVLSYKTQQKRNHTFITNTRMTLENKPDGLMVHRTVMDEVGNIDELNCVLHR
jgi:hypothetical protein